MRCSLFLYMRPKSHFSSSAVYRKATMPHWPTATYSTGMFASSSNNSEAPLLATRSLACERGGRELFRNLEFAISAGEVLTVSGANGAGKTSLLRLLAGIAVPAYGEVLFQGQPITRAANEYRSALSYLGHQPGTRRDETPLNHVQNRLALSLSVPAITSAAALDKVGLTRFVDRPCGELSVGQNRRAAVAWLIARQSPLWVLDEPLAGLDVNGQALVASLISEHAERGGAVVLTTHQALALPATVSQQQLTIGGAS